MEILLTYVTKKKQKKINFEVQGKQNLQTKTQFGKFKENKPRNRNLKACTNGIDANYGKKEIKSIRYLKR